MKKHNKSFNFFFEKTGLNNSFLSYQQYFISIILWNLHGKKMFKEKLAWIYMVNWNILHRTEQNQYLFRFFIVCRYTEYQFLIDSHTQQVVIMYKYKPIFYIYIYKDVSQSYNIAIIRNERNSLLAFLNATGPRVPCF